MATNDCADQTLTLDQYNFKLGQYQTVAAGSGPRSRGVGTARGAGDCGGEVVALPIPYQLKFIIVDLSTVLIYRIKILRGV